MKNEILIQSLEDLSLAVENYNVLKRKKDEKRLAFLALSKAFEVAVEYSWKALRVKVKDEGMNPQSPKAAIRDAAKIGIISDVEEWLIFVEARNTGVHDYFGIPEKDYVKITAGFLSRSRQIISKLT